MWYIHTGILLNNKMEWIFKRCNSMDKFQMYYANCVKPDSNGYIIWSHLYDILANGKL